MRSALPLLLLLAACAPKPERTDADEDGFTADVDCDDWDPAVHPGADEVCNNVDDDCDGEADEPDALDAAVFFSDADADGHGDPDEEVLACHRPAGTAEVRDDCDDTDPAIHPGASETDCTDPVDYNCDGSVGWADADADGFAACQDCDDTDDAVNPDATEVCNDVDDDCDGHVDLLASDAPTWFLDWDADGYGAAEPALVQCDQPAGYAPTDDDCDDAAPSVHPGAAEICNALDDDCDTLVDEEDPDVDLSTGPAFYADADADGYGDADVSTHACLAPEGYVADATDCDDTSDAISPEALEVCNEADDDCDGLMDDEDADVDGSTGSEFYADSDGDGYGDADTTGWSCQVQAGWSEDATDCDDTDADVHPGGDEICNSLDDDCDGLVDDEDEDVDTSTGSSFYVDSDLDGYGDPDSTVMACAVGSGWTSDDTDCDDTDADISPAAHEICNELDDDCDGLVDDDDPMVDLSTGSTFYVDVDGDGHGDPDFGITACAESSGFVAAGDDCDPDDADISPSADDPCEDGIDQDCDGVDDPCLAWLGELDADTDYATAIYSTTASASLGNMATVMDWDGDGVLDLVSGASASDAGGTYRGGAVYVHLGPLDAGDVPDTDAELEVYSTEMRAGCGLRTVGLPDLDGDGDEELHITCSKGSYGGIIEGDSTSGSQDITSVVSLSVQCASMGGVGDQDSDGTPEWACGDTAASSVYIYEGLSTTAVATLSTTRTNAYFGHSLVAGEDLDGDGVEDLWVGAPWEYYAGGHDGAAYLILGPHSTMSMTSADAVAYGEVSYQELGNQVMAGDLDGDGYGDYLAGSDLDDTAYTNAGAWYAWMGPLSGSTTVSSADLTLYGDDTEFRIGGNDADMVDIDGDGRDDLLVTVIGSSVSPSGGGDAWIFYGPLSGTIELADAEADGAHITSDTGDNLGTEAFFAEDLTGDGELDLVLGANLAAYSSTYTGGMVWVLSSQ